MKAKVYHLVYKSLKLDFVLSQLKPVHALYIYYILHTIFYIYIFTYFNHYAFEQATWTQKILS